MHGLSDYHDLCYDNNCDTDDDITVVPSPCDSQNVINMPSEADVFSDEYKIDPLDFIGTLDPFGSYEGDSLEDLITHAECFGHYVDPSWSDGTLSDDAAVHELATTSDSETEDSNSFHKGSLRYKNLLYKNFDGFSSAPPILNRQGAARTC